MNDLTTPTKTMSSAQLAELLGYEKKEINKKIRRMFGDNVAREKFSPALDSQNRIDFYNFPEKESKMFVAKYDIDYLEQVIQFWIDQGPKTVLPQNFAEALELAAAQARKLQHKDQLLIATNEASIKAGEILIREFVKAHDFIHIGEKQMYQWLKEQNIIMPTREPYQHYVDRDYFTWKPTQEEHGGRFRYTLRITPRGKVWLATKYMAHLENELEIA